MYVKKNEGSKVKVYLASSNAYVHVYVRTTNDLISNEGTQDPNKGILTAQTQQSISLPIGKIKGSNSLMDITGEKRVQTIEQNTNGDISNINKITQVGTDTISSNFKFLLSDHSKSLVQSNSGLQAIASNPLVPKKRDLSLSSGLMGDFIRELEMSEGPRQRTVIPAPSSYLEKSNISKLSSSSYLKIETPEIQSIRQKQETDQKLNNNIKQYKDYLLNNLKNK